MNEKMNKDILEKITKLSLRESSTFKILTPNNYFDIFNKNAKLLEVNLDLEKVKETKIDEIITKATDNIDDFSKNATKAQVAIEQQDIQALEEVKKHMSLLQSKLHELQEEINKDALTAAYNRKWFEKNYIKEDKFCSDGILVFIDLNDFKQINDNQGHIVGDMVLKFLASFLAQKVKEASVIRYAGDEFMLIIDKTDVDYYEKLMSSVQEELAKKELKSNKIKSLSFSFSYGIKPFNLGNCFKEVIESADKKMYDNKKTFKEKLKKLASKERLKKLAS